MVRRTLVIIAVSSLAGACEPKSGTTTPDDGATRDDGSAAPADGEAEPEAPKPVLVEQVQRIEGGLREAQVQAVIEDHFPEIRACFDAGLASNPDGEIDGAIVVAISVDASGKVTQAETELNETGDDATESCILAEVGKWTFAEPKGGKATIHHPFYLRSY